MQLNIDTNLLRSNFREPCTIHVEIRLHYRNRHCITTTASNMKQNIKTYHKKNRINSQFSS